MKVAMVQHIEAFARCIFDIASSTYFTDIRSEIINFWQIFLVALKTGHDLPESSHSISVESIDDCGTLKVRVRVVVKVVLLLHTAHICE